MDRGDLAGVPKTPLSYNILVRACDVDVVGSAAAQAAHLAGSFSERFTAGTTQEAGMQGGAR